MDEQNNLGGRLPLLEPAALTRPQRDLYECMAKDLLPWAKKSGFQAETASGEVLGPFNALLWSEEIGTGMVNYLAVERAASGLDATVREVVILTVGAACNSAYELYAHRAVAAKAGLSAEVIEELASGREPAGLNASEAAAHRFVKALVVDHRVPDEIFREAHGIFGNRCLVDMVHLAGLYLTTSALLNAFDVPVPRG